MVPESGAAVFLKAGGKRNLPFPPCLYLAACFDTPRTCSTVISLYRSAVPLESSMPPPAKNPTEPLRPEALVCPNGPAQGDANPGKRPKGSDASRKNADENCRYITVKSGWHKGCDNSGTILSPACPAAESLRNGRTGQKIRRPCIRRGDNPPGHFSTHSAASRRTDRP